MVNSDLLLTQATFSGEMYSCVAVNSWGITAVSLETGFCIVMSEAAWVKAVHAQSLAHAD